MSREVALTDKLAADSATLDNFSHFGSIGEKGIYAVPTLITACTAQDGFNSQLDCPAKLLASGEGPKDYRTLVKDVYACDPYTHIACNVQAFEVWSAP